MDFAPQDFCVYQESSVDHGIVSVRGNGGLSVMTAAMTELVGFKFCFLDIFLYFYFVLTCLLLAVFE